MNRVLFNFLLLLIILLLPMKCSADELFTDAKGVTWRAWVHTPRFDVAECIVPDSYKGPVVIPNEVDGFDVRWIYGYPTSSDSFVITSSNPVDLVLPSNCSVGNPYWVTTGLFEKCSNLASITIPANFSLN